MSRNLAALRAWHQANGFRQVEMIEKPAPPEYRDEDYSVVTIVEFAPRSAETMYAEIWLTDDDQMGLGVERYDKVARRLGGATKATRFVAGFEPGVDFERLAPALDLVASGEIVIDAVCLPVFGVAAVGRAPKARLKHITDACGRMALPLRQKNAGPFWGFTRLAYSAWT